jgi:hypothetical protein
MSRTGTTRVVCIAAAALLIACSSSVENALRAGAESEPTIVQFTYQTVSPEVVRIPSAGNVGWQNLADDAWGLVVFPASIASAFRCQDLHPYFTRSEGVYRSLPVTNPESQRVQLPCPLTPGSYDYEVWLMGVGFGGEYDSGTPQRILRAKIIVE